MQTHLRQLATRNLRLIMIGTAMEIFRRIEANYVARRSPARSSGTLRGRCLADSSYFEGRKSCPWRIVRYSRQTGIDHHPNTVDRDGALSDIRRKDYFALVRRLNRAVLLGWRKIAVKLCELQIVAASDWFADPRGTMDGCRARQKYQDVAGDSARHY